jgi:hypothetical protein
VDEASAVTVVKVSTVVAKELEVSNVGVAAGVSDWT